MLRIAPSYFAMQSNESVASKSKAQPQSPKSLVTISKRQAKSPKYKSPKHKSPRQKSPRQKSPVASVAPSSNQSSMPMGMSRRAPNGSMGMFFDKLSKNERLFVYALIGLWVVYICCVGVSITLSIANEVEHSHKQANGDDSDQDISSNNTTQQITSTTIATITTLITQKQPNLPRKKVDAERVTSLDANFNMYKNNVKYRLNIIKRSYVPEFIDTEKPDAEQFITLESDVKQNEYYRITFRLKTNIKLKSQALSLHEIRKYFKEPERHIICYDNVTDPDSDGLMSIKRPYQIGHVECVDALNISLPCKLLDGSNGNKEPFPQLEIRNFEWEFRSKPNESDNAKIQPFILPGEKIRCFNQAIKMDPNSRSVLLYAKGQIEVLYGDGAEIDPYNLQVKRNNNIIEISSEQEKFNLKLKILPIVTNNKRSIQLKAHELDLNWANLPRNCKSKFPKFDLIAEADEANFHVSCNSTIAFCFTCQDTEFKFVFDHFEIEINERDKPHTTNEYVHPKLAYPCKDHFVNARGSIINQIIQNYQN